MLNESTCLMDDIDVLIKNINEKLQYDLEFLITFYKMNLVNDELIKNYGSYGKFVKNLDDKYGLIDDDMCNKMLDIIGKNLNAEIVTVQNLYNLLNVDYNKYTILAYVLQGIKHKKNKVRIDAINKKEYIDISKSIPFDLGMIINTFKN